MANKPTIKRYEPTMDSAGRFFQEEAEGRAVMYRDYQKLEAQLDAVDDRLRKAEEENKELRAEVGRLKEEVENKELRAEAGRLKEEVENKELRAEAGRLKEEVENKELRAEVERLKK